MMRREGRTNSRTSCVQLRLHHLALRHAFLTPHTTHTSHTHSFPHLLDAQAARQLRVLLGLAAAQLPTRALEACVGTHDRQYQYLESLQVCRYKQRLGSLNRQGLKAHAQGHVTGNILGACRYASTGSAPACPPCIPTSSPRNPIPNPKPPPASKPPIDPSTSSSAASPYAAPACPTLPCTPLPNIPIPYPQKPLIPIASKLLAAVRPQLPHPHNPLVSTHRPSTPSAIPTCFEATHGSIHQQQCGISLCRSCDRIGHEVAVPRRIKQRHVVSASMAGHASVGKHGCSIQHSATTFLNCLGERSARHTISAETRLKINNRQLHARIFMSVRKVSCRLGDDTQVHCTNLQVVHTCLCGSAAWPRPPSRPSPAPLAARRAPTPMQTTPGSRRRGNKQEAGVRGSSSVVCNHTAGVAERPRPCKRRLGPRE